MGIARKSVAPGVGWVRTVQEKIQHNYIMRGIRSYYRQKVRIDMQAKGVEVLQFRREQTEGADSMILLDKTRYETSPRDAKHGSAPGSMNRVVVDVCTDTVRTKDTVQQGGMGRRVSRSCALSGMKSIGPWQHSAGLVYLK